MSASELKVCIELQLMIAHPRAPGDPEPKRSRSSAIRRLLNFKGASDVEEPPPRRRSEAQVLDAQRARDDKKWPSRNLILPAHDARLGFPAKRCLWKVCDLLATSGFPVACYYPPDPQLGDPVTTGMNKSNTTVVTGDNGSQFRTWNGSVAFHTSSPRDRYWLITHELGTTERVRKELVDETPVGYKWFCIGIKSPAILDKRELNLRDTQCSQRLPSLGAVLHEIRSELKIWTNHLCGLTIQVQPAEGKFEAATSKKAAALISLLEKPLFSKFSEPSRVTGNEQSLISTSSKIASGEWGHSKEDTASKPIVRNLIAHRKDEHRAQVKGYAPVHLLLYRILTQADLCALHEGLLQDSHAPCSFAITAEGVATFSYSEASLKTEYIAIWVDIARSILRNAMMDDEAYGKVLTGLYDMKIWGREMGWINHWNLLGVRDKEGENGMWWVKRIAHGYRVGEQVNGKTTL